MDFRNPQTMTPQEIVAEIRDIQKGLSRGATRIHELSRALYHRMRRTAPGDDTNVYITYSNAWTRFAGMVSQGLVRTRSAERILGMLRTEEPPPQTPPPPPPTRERQESSPERSPMEDLIAAYQEETPFDADRR